MQKLQLIQCGVGGMGGAWLKNATGKGLSSDFDLAAIVDISEKALTEAGDANDVPGKLRFKSLQQALKKVQADAVLTVTPPVVHAKHAKLAFSRGLHVMTEKPIADTLANARKMVQWANEAKKQLVVTQNYRFGPPMIALRKLLAAKPVGELGHGHLDFYIAADFTGSFRETMEYPLLVDMAIHHLDLIRAVTGKNIARVSVRSFRPAWSWYQHEPGLKMLLELEDGTPFSYSGDWSALGKQTGWNGEWRLQCADGSIHSADNELKVWRCQRWGKDQQSEKIEVPEGENAQARLLREFAQAIRTGNPAETHGQDNLWSFAAVIAGVMSAKKGRPVDVAPLVGN